jgi:hypothetical protein
MLNLRAFFKSGVGEAPSRARPNAVMPSKRWIEAGDYTYRALWPMDAFHLQFQLASLFGEQALVAAFDLLVMAAAADEPREVDFREAYAAVRGYLGGHPEHMPLKMGLVRDKFGELWVKAMKRLYDIMPDEREMNIAAFIGESRPYFRAVAPLLAALDADAAMNIVRHMLHVRHPGGSGLYVRDQPCTDDSTINALVPDTDLPTISFVALLFNLRPFTEAGRTTNPSPGPPKASPAPTSTGRTPSRPGGATASRTSTGGPPKK